MNKNQTPRYLIIAVVLAWAFYAIWPSIRYYGLSDESKEIMREEGTLKALESKILKQGLDLKGGMYIVLEVDVPQLIQNLAQNKDSKFNRAMDEVLGQMDTPEADFFDLFTIIAKEHQLRLPRYFHEYGATDEAIITGLTDEADDAINRVLEILQNRVDQFGVAEPTIQKQGNNRIIVELAGVQDSERARGLLQSTALLEFFIVKSSALTNETLVKINNIVKGNENLLDLIEDSPAKTDLETQVVDDEVLEDSQEDETISVSELFGEPQVEESEGDSAIAVDQLLDEDLPFSSLLTIYGGDLMVAESKMYTIKKMLDLPEVKANLEAENAQFLFSNEAEPLDNMQLYRLYHLEKEPELSGGVIEEAKANLGGQGSGSSGLPVVILTMNTEGSKDWARITGANVGRRVAIVLDKKVHMAPNIREKISRGNTQIEGFADINEAKDIAIVLRAGALPAPVTIIEERVIGPSLGADSVRMGTLSVMFGLVLVIIFMFIYYKQAGLIADFALIWNLLLVLAVLASLQATLTLPGIAALILTIGMSIDSNVIIFERIREELRKGKTPRSAVDSGYSNAIRAIIDANVTTLIAALVLYQFGTGPIRGFATVLFWGIVISMFTAIFVTRTIFNSMTNRSNVQRLSI